MMEKIVIYAITPNLRYHWGLFVNLETGEFVIKTRPDREHQWQDSALKPPNYATRIFIERLNSYGWTLDE